MPNNQNDWRATHLIVGALCIIIALLMALSLGSSAGQVDPPKQDNAPENMKWEDIQTCMYECGGRAGV